jgi:hypothetical protein
MNRARWKRWPWAASTTENAAIIVVFAHAGAANTKHQPQISLQAATGLDWAKVIG